MSETKEPYSTMLKQRLLRTSADIMHISLQFSEKLGLRRLPFFTSSFFNFTKSRQFRPFLILENLLIYFRGAQIPGAPGLRGD